jgi:hypothetical protein
MLHTSTLRTACLIGFIRGLKRLAAALLLAALLPVWASAYTVVLRNGRNVEIPSSFTLTPAGITYEYAPGLYVTIQMAGIDIAATERANNEASGTLLQRAERFSATAQGSSSPASQGTTQRRTLSDKDLEATRARREASETQYERRRRELGLPSVEETRIKREEEARRLSELTARAYAYEAKAESYWRARAEELREAIVVNEAEINYVRSRLRETTGYLPAVAFTTLSPAPYFPQVVGGSPINRLPGPGFRPGTVPGPRRAFPPRAPFTGRVGFGGGQTRGQIIFNGGPYRRYGRRYGFGSPVTTAPLLLPLYAPYAYNYSYDQGELVSRLQVLEAERAGLQARWRLLEDEARRAGAPPGWLRP